MKKITLLFLLISLSIQFSFAQSEKQADMKIDTLTTEENLKWLEDFKKIESKAKKIQAIKDKIVFDSAYGGQIYNTGCSFAKNRPNINYSDSNPLISQDKIFFATSSSNNVKKISSILELRMFENSTNEVLLLLNKNTVSSITIVEEITGITSMKFVIITIKDRKTRKKIKQIQKEHKKKH